VDQPLGITIESLAPDTVCVSLSGELDFNRAYTFDEEMRRLESTKPKSIVLDLRSLNFLDAAGVALLQRTSVRSALEGWAFAVRTTGVRYLARRAAA
jgi:anti-anti-sigma factor